MSDLNNIFADVEKEGDPDPFAALETETPSDSQPEKEPEVEEPVEGDDTPPIEEEVPFHKHPRWIERERELEELRRRDAEREEELSSIRQAVESKRDPSDEPIPAHFVELYGDNPLAYQKWKEYEDLRKEETKREVIEDLRRAQAEEAQESQKWVNWVDESLQALKDSGKDFDRNELIKTMLDYKPTDAEGNFDFEAGYKIYEALNAKEVNPAKSLARKQLADTTTRSSHTEPTKRDYLTPADLRGKSWGAL